MKTVSLIGSKGFIGKHLEYYLRSRGFQVVGYDVIPGEDNNYVQCDISNRDEIERICLDVDYIYMFAGLTGTRIGFDKYRDFTIINELGLNNLLDAIRRSSYRPRIIFPSSRLVYKGKEHPLSEDAEKETKTIYAVNKIACENLLYSYSNMFGIPYTIFRICVPFGNMLANDYSFGTIGTFIRQAQERNRITLYGDGKVKRTFTSMEDLCRQIELVSLSSDSENQIFNIGGCAHTLYEVAKEIADYYSATLDLTPFPDDDRRIESGSTFFDSTKIERLTKYSSYQDVSTLFK